MASPTTPKHSSKPSFSSTSSSDSGPSMRLSSPLNPASPSLLSSTTPGNGRTRGHSVSTIREAANTTPRPSPSAGTITNIPFAETLSSFKNRSRSRSPSRGFFEESEWQKKAADPSVPRSGSSRWGHREEQARDSWDEAEKPKKLHIPEEHREIWERTKLRVHQTAAVILDVSRQGLELGVDFLEFAPVPGLAPTARMLLKIWDNVEGVDMNRMACLRLTHRCAESLLAVRIEVHEAGEKVSADLSHAITTLTFAFEDVYRVLSKQAARPFLRRYLKREEILGELVECDKDLARALSQFGMSVQVRALKQSFRVEDKVDDGVEKILEYLDKLQALKNASIAPTASNALQLSGLDNTPQPTGTKSVIEAYPLPTSSATRSPATNSGGSIILPSVPIAFSAASLPSPSLPADARSPSQILQEIENIRKQQNAEDADSDMADLRNLMTAVLAAGSDVEILELLRVSKDEMPEAIKTLQRALEKICERDRVDGPQWEEVEVAEPERPRETARSGLTKMVRRVSMSTNASSKESTDGSETAMKRSKTVITRSSEGSGGSNTRPVSRKDTLDREFLENGIDALRRLSHGSDTSLNLPGWTITRYEVDREKKIGMGYFSDVYKGRWRSQVVAIKVLAETTPRNLFIREVEIWKQLRHPNVLELHGASSTSGDPPWFLVSPYVQHGSLSNHLRRMAPNIPPGALSGDWARLRAASVPVWDGGGMGSLVGLGIGMSEEVRSRRKSGGNGPPPYNGEIGKEWDLLKFMYEIAKGMDYLHGQGVLHGDLKASNVLVNDSFHCLITDFGQSEMRSEAFRISGQSPPHGTLRWQAPELMQHTAVFFTTEMDVYAFAMSCVEILSLGRVPWALTDDQSVRHFVLNENTRPQIPPTRFTTGSLQDLINLCWDSSPPQRPRFSTIVQQLKIIRERFGIGATESSPHIAIRRLDDEERAIRRASPPMYPMAIPELGASESQKSGLSTSPGSDSNSYITATSGSPPMGGLSTYGEPTMGGLQMPEPVPYVHSVATSTRVATSKASSIRTSSGSDAERSSGISSDQAGYESEPILDERQQEIWNERRYRMLLNHDYHPSLTLALWYPSQVDLGAIGYLSKPKGEFVTLFNALYPEQSDLRGVRGMSSIRAYGDVHTGSQRFSDRERRNGVQRGFDALAGLLNNLGSRQSKNELSPGSRRATFPLRAGHKAAYLITDTAKYNYVTRLDVAKKWFKENIDEVVSIYGKSHRVQREEILLVIGTLTAKDYGLMVSHNHPNGQTHFNAFSSPPKGTPWGEFQMESMTTSGIAGPDYDEARGPNLNATKISSAGGSADALLVAKLRFRPDGEEPTSL